MSERPDIHPVDRLLGPGGALAKAIPGYESREAQLAFAHDVATVLEDGGALFAEAPTGVGKSLGYLVPALLWSRRERSPVVISTHTKQLQGQLTDEDLPRLAEVVSPAPRVVRLKGKHNYLCPRRWKLHVAEHKKRGARATRAETEAAAWVEATKTGDLDEFAWSAHPGGAALKPRIGFDRSFCNATACRPGGDCPWRKARRLAGSAELVVVNHALLVTGMSGTNVLPAYRALIVDEAHHLDAVFTAQLTVQQSLTRIDTLLEQVAGSPTGQGTHASALDAIVLGAATLLKAPERAELAAATETLRGLAPLVHEAGRAFFAGVAASLDGRGDPGGPYEPRARFRQLEELTGDTYEPLERLFAAAREGEESLRRVASVLARGPQSPMLDDLAGDLAGVSGGWQDWHADLRFLTDPRSGKHVYWRSGGHPETATVVAAPVEVAEIVRTKLLPDLTAVVLASATLAANGSFRFVRERLGLAEGAELEVTERVYPSPFDFPRQLGAFVLDVRGARTAVLDEATLSPTRPREDEHVATVVAELHRRLRRNTLVLFTSHLKLRRAAKRLKTALGDASVWAQDVDGSAVELARRFRDARGALLLGVASFWEGVDFPGEALEVLVLTGLPFPVPDEPLVEARREKVEEAGERGFARVDLPEAVLRFRQGVGRLLRRRTDRGVIVLLDDRIVTRGYGSHFRKGLPVALRSAASTEDLVTQAAAFFAARGEGAA